MANENALRSVMDSIGLGEEENVNSLGEMRNELIDKLSEQIEEGTKQLDELKSGAEKVASQVISGAVEVEQSLENKAAEVLEETKEKLSEPISTTQCALSEAVSNLGTLAEQVEKKISGNLEDFKEGMNRLAEDSSKFVSQKVDQFGNLQKIEEKTEHIASSVMDKAGLLEDIGKVVSEMSVGVEELQKKTTEAVAHGLEEAKDKVCTFAGHIQEAVSEEKSKFSGEINEEIAMRLNEGKEKMEEFVDETFAKIQKLNEEKSDEGIIGIDEEVDGFKQEMDGKVDEANKVEDVTSGSDDGRERIVDGQMDGISVAPIANENVKKDELLVANSVGTSSVPSDATDAIGGDSQRDFMDGFVEEAGKMKEMAEKILSESVNAQEPQAIKKILPEGARVPGQAGILLENGVYLDDYDPVKPESMLTEKLDFVTDSEAFDAHTKLNEPVGDVTQQEVHFSEFTSLLINLK
uniref:Uncharacterized protein n=1 Tax=Setaria digitata TaxID=48799 RepID=A0A915PL67_9BILA